jgi:hypothetical protein
MGCDLCRLAEKREGKSFFPRTSGSSWSIAVKMSGKERGEMFLDERV